MKIGYFVQGAADEAFIHGLARRWCPDAQLAPGKFRGGSRQSLRRELPKALRDLREFQNCDILVVLTDSDTRPWREVRQEEWNRVPVEFHHDTVLGVADRNIECWLALDRAVLARVLECGENDISRDDPSDFIKNRLGLTRRGPSREEGRDTVTRFVAEVSLRDWIGASPSFAEFYDDIRRLSANRDCSIPNERNRAEPPG
jgi:hypothetical protein